MLLSAVDSQSPQTSLPHRFVDAVGLEQAAVVFPDFPGDMAIPPVGGQSVIAVIFLRRFDRDVIRSPEPDDVWCLPGYPRVAAALAIGDKAKVHFAAGIGKGFKIPDLSLDTREV